MEEENLAEVRYYKSTGEVTVNSHSLSEDFPSLFPSMTTPKNPEEIVRGLQEMLTPEARIVSDPNGGALSAIHYDTLPLTNESLQNFLRSSMASLLLWASEQMPKRINDVFIGVNGDVMNIGDASAYNHGLDDCRTLLTNEARKITDNG